MGAAIRTLVGHAVIAGIGGVVGALVVGGGPVAAFDVPENSVTSAKIVNGAVRSEDLRNGGVEGVDIKSGAVSAGHLAPVIRPMWAKVDADAGSANVLGGRGVTGVAYDGTGIYQVDFARSVVTCGWTATRNDNFADIAASGEITVERLDPSDPNSLIVRTRNSSGSHASPEDSDGFTIVVHC